LSTELATPAKLSSRPRPRAVDQPRRGAQLAVQQVGSGQVVEGELQVHEGAGVTGELGLARGHDMPGFVVPQLKGDDLTHSSAGRPEPAAGFAGASFAGAGFQSENQLEGTDQRGCGRDVPLRHPQDERVEQDVDRARRFGSGRRGAGGLGGLPHARTSVERTETPGRAEQ